MPSTNGSTRRLGADEASARLGVKRETLYAYVSRGMLVSERTPDGRSSTFDPVEVERLAGRGRRSKGAGEVDVVIGTQLTRIADDQLWYRGRSAVEAAETMAFEQVAEWLWTGEDGDRSPWVADPVALAVATAVVSALPENASVTDRYLAITAAARSTDHFRHDRRPDAVIATGRALVATLLDALPVRFRGPVPVLRLPGQPDRRDSIAGRLWTRVARRQPPNGMIRAVNACLVLAADHELAISTLAARVAASAWADPYAVVASGLGAFAGPLHGTASTPAHALLRDAEAAGDPAPVLGELVRSGGLLPGFGHTVYKGADPRAVALLRILRSAEIPPEKLAVVDAVLAGASHRVPVQPNVDFALASLCFCADLPVGSAEAFFGTARVVGWLAHALEEYGEKPLRFRPRAHYLGSKSARRRL